VEPHLEGKKKIIIVPSGDLAHVPWRIFFDMPITVVPSLEIWLRLQAEVKTKEPQQPKLSIVSTAPEDKEKRMKAEPYIRNIPFSRIEALYIARLHGHSPFLADDKDHSDLEDLTKDTQILHICAHSNFEPESPMTSSLELFRKPLTIRDWHKLSIKADLVVFSSCLSGYSKAYDSGSTIGFAHTLLGTGTKAFIGSLWKVNDRATLLLMTMFYEELRKPLPAVDALYEAQRRMRNLTNDGLREMVDRLEQVALQNGKTRPYVINARYWLEDLRYSDAKEWQQERYWAAFVLTGYGSNIIYPGNDEGSS
jgi:CHAT domain-containing protein